MRDPRRPLHRSAAADQRRLDEAREAALDVARVAQATSILGAWQPGGNHDQAGRLAAQIVALDEEMGAVCDADLAGMHIPAMAEMAILVERHALADLDAGLVVVQPGLEALVDGSADRRLAAVAPVVTLL